MSDTIFLINQVIHDMEKDCDYRLLWTSGTEEQPSYWLKLPGNSNVPEAISPWLSPVCWRSAVSSANTWLFDRNFLKILSICGDWGPASYMVVHGCFPRLSASSARVAACAIQS